jgi:hypothetical protein
MHGLIGWLPHIEKILCVLRPVWLVLNDRLQLSSLSSFLGDQVSAMNASRNLFLSLRLASVLLAMLGLPYAVFAHPSDQSLQAASSYDLGLAFPRAMDRSKNPLWRVYVFERQGVRYFQINDAFGHVRAVFAVENGDFLVLPSGTDADRVVVPGARPKSQERLACAACSVNRKADVEENGVMGAVARSDDSYEVIYRDTDLSIAVTEADNELPVWIVRPVRSFTDAAQMARSSDD